MELCSIPLDDRKFFYLLYFFRFSLLGLPYAGDPSNAETGVRSDELFWMRKPDVIEILNFFKKHHTIFSVEVARKVHETDPLGGIYGHMEYSKKLFQTIS